MKYYLKLACNGIKNNRRIYIPYILSSIGMVMMFYIVKFLSVNDLMEKMRGGSSCASILKLGSGVVAIFAVMFMFYTNSFVMKKRKKEFGLYNILGMGKKHIYKILFIENLIIAVTSIVAGVGFGILFSKLAELGMVNIMRTDVSYKFSVSSTAIKYSFLIFGLIFVILLINAFRQIHLAKPLNLLKSENQGEKPPKVNWILGVLGIALLGYAYYLAVSIKEPIAAINVFFKAVLMVIVGSYLLFISGSVMICKILQRNKKYYYKKNHFTSVSTMSYRMKRNGAGLASICVLVTIVLVMISSSACLFVGEEDSLERMYPRRYSFEVAYKDVESASDEAEKKYEDSVKSILTHYGSYAKDVLEMRYIVTYGLFEDGKITISSLNENMMNGNLEKLMALYFVPVSDYKKYYDVDEDLKPGQALVYMGKSKYEEKELNIDDKLKFVVVDEVDEFINTGILYTDVIKSAIFIVPDYENVVELLCDSNGDYEKYDIKHNWIYSFDADVDFGTDNNEDWLFDNISSYFPDHELFSFCDREEFRDEFYGTFGGLFFIGILLSIIFVGATVLIIYYKHISEGLEDQPRFEIMKKIGMTKKEIRKNINSQVLLVFFLPIIIAVIHLCFAFPIVEKMLLLFGLNNRKLFLIVSALSVLLCSITYAVVYKLTSNVYYKIVNSKK